MNWIDAVKWLRKSRENNQLVIFVGAGVSKNSGIPTWSELIRKIAEEIGYDKCASCKRRKAECPYEGCADRYSYTQEEFLRIPEYFYQGLPAGDKESYYELIQKTLRSDKGPNPIDDEIVNLLPHHIITTNYDHLLEQVKSVNSSLYAVVAKDSDLLSTASERYILKMHGDIEDPTSIVLRENDYIDYEQNHTLISTFIRSLLINHTFLFLGYSLNDYNLNLIIGWINYFRRTYDIRDYPLNFLVDTKSPSEFEKLRLAEKSIDVISLQNLPDDLVSKISMPEMLSHPTGQKLYCLLRCISDTQLLDQYIPIRNQLIEKYRVLKAYNRISVFDLLNVQPLGGILLRSNHLVFLEKKWFKQIASLIDNGESEIRDTFGRAGIAAIDLFRGETYHINYDVDLEQTSFALYLDNNYCELARHIESSTDTAAKIYYYVLLHENTTDDPELARLINEDAAAVQNDDIITLLLHKNRVRLATFSNTDFCEQNTREIEKIYKSLSLKYMEATKTLRTFFESSSDNILKMKALLEKQEKRYEYGTHSWYSGHSYENIWEMQPYVYDYYFFFKLNYLSADSFAEPRNYFSYYLKAILCSYSPVESSQKDSFFGSMQTDRRHYILNEIDLDLFVKYSNPKQLISWIEQYSVQKLEVDSRIDVLSKFINLCSSLAGFHNTAWIDHIHCFVILICLLNLDEQAREAVVSTVVETFSELTAWAYGCDRFFEPLFYLVTNLSVEKFETQSNELIGAMLTTNAYSVLYKRHRGMLFNITKKLAPNITAATKERLTQMVDKIADDSEKIEKIVFWRNLLPAGRYTDYLAENVNLIDGESLFSLIVEKKLPYSEECQQRLLSIIEKEHLKKKHSKIRSYPDYLSIYIDDYLLLNLVGLDIDISLLKPYAEYSEHLRFMLDPNAYDYSNVDFTDYMWQNLIYSDTYQKYFLRHKHELLSEKLHGIFKRNVDSRDQQKIVYGLLLEERELREY